MGPTASGKSEMAVKLALRLSSGQAKKKFGINGAEIISADSRQVYRGMDIGTAKPTQKEMAGIPHYLINIISPKKIFTVTQYRKLALKAINKILKKGKIPILCGGTGFYIQAIIDGLIIPEIEPDWKLREKLEKKSAEELFNKLKELDPKRAETIDKKNKRRLIRALEIVIKTKEPVPLADKKPFPYPVLMLGINLEKENLEDTIKKRIEKMIRKGLEKEVKNLVEKYGWVPALQTIGYQEWEQYFNDKIDKKEVKDLIILHTKQFARRQMTWFKRDRRINWIKNYREAPKKSLRDLTGQAEKLVKEFLNE